MPERDPTGDEISTLLRQPMPPDVEQFARILLYDYRDKALEAARSKADRQRREELVAEARRRLRDKLRNLLALAKETDRM